MAVSSTEGPILTTITSGTVTQVLVLKTTTYTDCPCEPTTHATGIAAALSNAPVVVTTSGGNKILPGVMIGVVGLMSGIGLMI